MVLVRTDRNSHQCERDSGAERSEAGAPLLRDLPPYSFRLTLFSRFCPFPFSQGHPTHL